nr:ankyrin repeat-containing protein ITN1-like isoform X1 [Coffea arabica]
MASSRINEDRSNRSAAYRAVLEGKKQSVETFRSINVDAFRLLLQDGLVTIENLKAKNVNGHTALHEAARFGHKDVAEIMLRTEKDLVSERNKLGETPLFVAAACGKKEVFSLLEKYIGDCMMRRNDGCTILHAAVIGGYYSLCWWNMMWDVVALNVSPFQVFALLYQTGLAIGILESYPDLAGKRNEKGKTALHLLAAKPESFRSGSAYTLNDLGRKSLIPLHILRAIIYWCIAVLYKESQPVNSVEEPSNSASIHKLNRSSFANFILGFPWLKEIDDAKQSHAVALMLAERLIRREDWSHYVHTGAKDHEGSQFGISSEKKNSMPDPLIQATRLGIIEVVQEILSVYPEAVYTFDGKGRNILQIAVEEKKWFLYDHLMTSGTDRDRMLSAIDHEGNSIIHLAALLESPPSVPPGVFHQMMWEALWFKRVQYDSFPHLWQLQNSDGTTAKQVFETNHARLREKAEETVRALSNSVLIVSVLIGTINFAAIFTVPGGFDQTTGEAIFLKNRRWEFGLLMFYLAGGLFSSLFTMGTVLVIIFLRFTTEDFYISLPCYIVTNIISIFYSTVFTIVAAGQALIVQKVVITDYRLLVVVFFIYCLLALVLMETSYLIFDYVYYLIRNCLCYRGQES